MYGKRKEIVAVDSVSFSVNEGEIFGIIGPDGAGKTSLFRMLTTLLLPDSGKATVDGFDIVKDYKKIRNNVGYMPGRFSLYQDMTIEENLTFFATVFGTTIEENYNLIEDIYKQIEKFKTRRAGKLSGGMKQKLALCCALIHKPTVLFLDEPTTGVDPVSRKEFWEMLKRLKEQNITILVSTPYMDEATLCDRIALMQEGKIMSVDTPKNIMASYPQQLYSVKASDMYGMLKSLKKWHSILSSYTFGEYAHVSVRNESDNTINEIMKYLQEQGHTAIEVKPTEATIEDSFIQLLSDKKEENGDH
ncbi:ABC transporter ATP-binding protein [Flavobacterium amniphilum]|uniref:ABC transporter ATP-binding protein n=1 Tax=Flavobacterium amniphilum TaxID=1834035 RepID=UPI002029B8E6|nr:ABC transporter ATP-binding protein [Flavobacterium amniphilum]MCL9805890.1 ABC transporter ATP-binding protein [Flavobacterium amniphilum]